MSVVSPEHGGPLSHRIWVIHCHFGNVRSSHDPWNTDAIIDPLGIFDGKRDDVQIHICEFLSPGKRHLEFSAQIYRTGILEPRAPHTYGWPHHQ